MAKKEAKKKKKSRSQMTPFERWTLYLTAAGVLVTVVLQLPDLYDKYFRTVQSLVVIPLEVELTYTDKTVRHLASITFINDGDEDVVLRGFEMILSARDLKSNTPESIDSMRLPWKTPSFVLRAGDEATYEYGGEEVWPTGFLECSRTEPNLTESMETATLRLFFDASTLRYEGSLRQYVAINLRSRGLGLLVGGSQSPYCEDFARLDQKDSGKRPMPPQDLRLIATPPC